MNLADPTTLEKGLNAGNYKPSLATYLRSQFTPYTFLGAAITQEVIVPDESFWQDKNTTPQGINHYQMGLAGAKGVIIRGGQNLWQDEDFVTNWQAAKVAGLPRGSYWYLDPRADPKQQADKWAGMLVKDMPELDIWMDYEAPDSWGGAYAGWNGLYNFAERLKSNLPGQKISIYTGYYYWLAHSPPIGSASMNYFGQYPVNIAWYTTNANLVKIPPPWTKLRWWQFTSSGNGILYGVESAEIDLNYFNGTLEEYVSFFALDGGNPMPEDKCFKVTAASLNIRSSAENLGSVNDVGDLKSGDIVHALDVVINGGVTWHQIDKVYRLGEWVLLPLPFQNVSPTGKYFAAEKGVAVWMVEVPNPAPTPLPDNSELHIDLDMVDGKFTGTVVGVDGAGVPFSHTY